MTSEEWLDFDLAEVYSTSQEFTLVLKSRMPRETSYNDPDILSANVFCRVALDHHMN